MSKNVKVKSYRRRRQMERDVEKMLGKGWRIESQSGELSANPLWNNKVITVVWRFGEA